MRLLLIRHGQTVDNVNGALGTSIPGPELTKLGEMQAAAIPAALHNQRLDAIYASTMLRAQMTAAPLAADRGLPVKILQGIHEISAGELELRTDREAIDVYRSRIFAWSTDLSSRLPGGENGIEFLHRFGSAVQGVVDHFAGSPDACFAVISHGASIRAWALNVSHNVDPVFSREHPLDNTAVIVLETPGDGTWVIESWAGQPLGGTSLEDEGALDPTGEAE